MGRTKKKAKWDGEKPVHQKKLGKKKVKMGRWEAEKNFEKDIRLEGGCPKKTNAAKKKKGIWNRGKFFSGRTRKGKTKCLRSASPKKKKKQRERSAHKKWGGKGTAFGRQIIPKKTHKHAKKGKNQKENQTGDTVASIPN